MKHYSTRVLVYISLLTVLIIVSSIFSQQLLKKDSERMKSAIDRIEQRVGAEDWSGAGTAAGEVNGVWSKVKGKWSALIDHAEIDNIDISLSQLNASIKSKEPPESLLEAAALKTYIGHIPEREMLKLENLF